MSYATIFDFEKEDSFDWLLISKSLCRTLFLVFYKSVQNRNLFTEKHDAKVSRRDQFNDVKLQAFNWTKMVIKMQQQLSKPLKSTTEMHIRSFECHRTDSEAIRMNGWHMNECSCGSRELVKI